MLVISIFSFSHKVFCPSRSISVFEYHHLSSANALFLDLSRIMLFDGTQVVYLNTFPNKPWFLRVHSTGLLKTLWEKEKLLVMSNFFFSHSVFYLSRELSNIFINFKIVVCKLFQFGKSLKFGVWERVNFNQPL